MESISFSDCVSAAIFNSQLISEFDRLTGSNLSLKGTPLDIEIDRATGCQQKDIASFLAFVYEVIFTRVSNGA